MKLYDVCVVSHLTIRRLHSFMQNYTNICIVSCQRVSQMVKIHTKLIQSQYQNRHNSCSELSQAMPTCSSRRTKRLCWHTRFGATHMADASHPTLAGSDIVIDHEEHVGALRLQRPPLWGMDLFFDVTQTKEHHGIPSSLFLWQARK